MIPLITWLQKVVLQVLVESQLKAQPSTKSALDLRRYLLRVLDHFVSFTMCFLPGLDISSDEKHNQH